MINPTLLFIPLRNIAAHKATSLIVGSIIFFGTFVVVFGTALVDSVDESMTRSITSSVTGHIQAYSKDSKNKLTFFGGGFMGGDDYGEIPSFKLVREAIEPLENVKAVLPVGIVSTTLSSGGNRIDQTIEQLRTSLGNKNTDDVIALKERLLSMTGDLRETQNNLLKIAQDPKPLEDTLGHLQTVTGEDFWVSLLADPEPGLQFLESHIAKLGETGRTHYFRNMGIDFSRFSRFFDRFEIVSGAAVPQGQRGYLISTRWYEERLKHPIARAFDRIHKAKTLFNKTIESDADLASRVERLPRQYRRITYELSPAKTNALKEKLASFLSTQSTDIRETIQRFLTLTDENFDSRYDFFYQHIAPMLKLYWYDIGDTITLRSVTKSGYYKSLNVKFYGTYRFKGLEESDLAGAFNLLDMLSFRELYGVMTDQMKSELSAIRDEVGLLDVEQDTIEEELFGSDSDDGLDTLSNERFDSEVLMDAGPPLSASFNPEELDTGLAISAAIILNDPTALKETQAQIDALSEANDLRIQTIDWATASGIIGQLIILIKSVLYIAIFIIFLVALVIINNSMVMATTERTPEIVLEYLVAHGRDRRVGPAAGAPRLGGREDRPRAHQAGESGLPGLG